MTAADLQPMVLTVCGYCRKGAGGECHMPGCAFWMNRAPDVPLTTARDRDELIEDARLEMHDRSPVGASFADAAAVLIAAGVITAAEPPHG